MWDDQNIPESGAHFVVKTIHIKPNFDTDDVQPSCIFTLALAFLPLLKYLWSPHFMGFWDLPSWPVEFLESILSHKKRKQSHGTRSGEYCGWGMVQIWFFIKNCCTGRGMWQEALFSSIFHQMALIKHFSMSYTDEFVVHHNQTVEKSNRKDLLLRFWDPKFLLSKWYVGVPSEGLTFHLRIIDKDQRFIPNNILG